MFWLDLIVFRVAIFPAMAWVVLSTVLLVSGCALARFSETPAGQPVYVLAQPTCLLICFDSLGSIRGDGGSLSQSTTAGGAVGVAP